MILSSLLLLSQTLAVFSVLMAGVACYSLCRIGSIENVSLFEENSNDADRL